MGEGIYVHGSSRGRESKLSLAQNRGSGRGFRAGLSTGAEPSNALEKTPREKNESRRNAIWRGLESATPATCASAHKRHAWCRIEASNTSNTSSLRERMTKVCEMSDMSKHGIEECSFGRIHSSSAHICKSADQDASVRIEGVTTPVVSHHTDDENGTNDHDKRSPDTMCERDHDPRHELPSLQSGRDRLARSSALVTRAAGQ